MFKEKKNVITILPPILKTGLSFLVYLQVIPQLGLKGLSENYQLQNKCLDVLTRCFNIREEFEGLLQSGIASKLKRY